MFWPTTAIWNKQTEKHPRGSIYYTPLSVLVRAWLALAAHNGEYMLHPVAVTPAMFLIPIRLW